MTPGRKSFFVFGWISQVTSFFLVTIKYEADIDIDVDESFAVIHPEWLLFLKLLCIIKSSLEVESGFYPLCMVLKHVGLGVRQMVKFWLYSLLFE